MHQYLSAFDEDPLLPLRLDIKNKLCLSKVANVETQIGMRRNTSIEYRFPYTAI